MIRSEVAAGLDEAVEGVLAESGPEGEEARTRVYADPTLDADVPWTRRPVAGYEGLVSGTSRPLGASREET